MSICRKVCRKALDRLIEEVDVYSNLLIWAEENSALSTGSSEWSFGNGAVGNIGLRVPNGAVAKSMSYHADLHKLDGKVTIALMDCQTVTPVQLATFSIANAYDGEGSTGNAHKLENIDVIIPDNAVLGFRTISSSNSIADARVMVELQYKTGTALKFKGT